MYKILLVDDEEYIREGLKTFVDWGHLGFVVVGEAEDGLEALERIRELQPHVVLTDVKMPFYTGIELMEEMKALQLQVKIIVLSGYNEFEYASAAIDAGASGYLLKPVKVDKLKEKLSAVKRELDSQTLKELKDNQAYKILRESFMFKLVKGSFDNGSNVKAIAAEAGVRLEDYRYTVVIVEYDDYGKLIQKYKHDDLELLNFALKNVAEEIVNKTGDVHCFQNSRRSVGLLVGGVAYTKDDVRTAAEQLLLTIESLLKLKVTIYIGDTFSGVADIHSAYGSALRLRERKFFLGKSTVITAELPSPRSSVSNPPFVLLNHEQLTSLIQSMDADAVAGWIESSFSGLGRKEGVIDLYHQYVKCYMKFADRYDIHTTASAPAGSELEWRFETVDDVVAEVKTIFRQLLDAMEQEGNKSRNRLIDEVKNYIETHYHENISLESSAGRIKLHPMYVSKMFKRETGENFIDYVTKVRIAKAKQLLGNLDYKVYEVCEKVGYRDTKHFSKVFKHIVGVTPREYRKIVIGYGDEMEL